MPLKRGQKRIVNLKGKLQVVTFRKTLRSQTLNRRLREEGYLYDSHKRAWVLAMRKGWRAVFTTQQQNAVRSKLQDYRRVEGHIRDAVFKSINRVNRKLSDLVPVAYDEEAGLWVVNDYTSKGGKSIPIEIKIRFDVDNAEFDVESFQWRGDEVSGADLERRLNAPVLSEGKKLALNLVSEGFEVEEDTAHARRSIRELVYAEADVLGVRPPKVRIKNIMAKDLGLKRLPKRRDILGAFNARENVVLINPRAVIDEDLIKMFSGKKNVSISKDIERVVRHELLHDYVKKTKAIIRKGDVDELRRIGYKRHLDEEKEVRRLEKQSRL